METDSDFDQYSDTGEVSDASMDADDDDYFDTTADTHQRKVRGGQVCRAVLLLFAWVFQGPAHTHTHPPAAAPADQVRGPHEDRHQQAAAGGH